MFTALQGELGQSSFLRVTKPRFKGSALPVGFGASRTVFIPISSAFNAEGLFIRSPESLRRCDCKNLTAAMCAHGCGGTPLNASTRRLKDASPSGSRPTTFSRSRLLRSLYGHATLKILAFCSRTFRVQRVIFMVLERARRPLVIANPPPGDLYSFHCKCRACRRCSGAIRDVERRTPRMPSRVVTVYNGLRPCLQVADDKGLTA